MNGPTPTVEAAQQALEAWRHPSADGERLLELTADELEEAAAGLAEIVGWAKTRAEADDDLSWMLDYTLLARTCAAIAAEKREGLAADGPEARRHRERAELLVRDLLGREPPS